MAAEKAGASEVGTLLDGEGKMENVNNRPYVERKKSHVFSGDNFANIKAMTPLSVLVGIGVLAAAFMPRIAARVLAGCLVLPSVWRLFLRSWNLTPNPHMANMQKGVWFTAQVDGDYCVFLLGARSNAPWKLNKSFNWLNSTFLAITKEVECLPASAGYLGGESYVGTNFTDGSHAMVVMYWRSWQQLKDYAWSKEHLHSKVMGEMLQTARNHPELGIWHEAYEVTSKGTHSTYLNCPPFGLADAFEVKVTRSLT